ncbi:hypothetical protein D3C83_237930 [compost metagenome]
MLAGSRAALGQSRQTLLRVRNGADHEFTFGPMQLQRKGKRMLALPAVGRQ